MRVILSGDPSWCRRAAAVLPRDWPAGSFVEAPDLGLLVRASTILREPELSFPRLGWVNLHLGRLPDYRGIRPITRALLNGDRTVTATWHRVDEGVDTGPILREVPIPVKGRDAVALFDLLMEAAIEDLRDFAPSLPRLLTTARPQEGRGVLVTRKSWARAMAWR